MFKILIKLINLLDKDQKKNTYIVQSLNVLVSLIEILTLGSLAIFLGTLVGVENILANKHLNFFYNFFNFDDHYNFLFSFGVLVLCLYIFSGLFNIFVTWKTNSLASTIVQSLSSLIIKNYAYKSWHEFTTLKLSNINKNVFTDVNIVSTSIITPIFTLFNKIFVAFALTLTLAIYNFKVACVGILIYSSVYFLLIISIKKITAEMAYKVSKNRNKNHSFVHNFFSGFKEVVIFNLQSLYFEKIKKNNDDMIFPTAYLSSITQIPRFIVELLSYVTVISVILLFIYNGDNLDSLLPLVAIYAFAGLKLLPAFQQIYLAYSRIKVGEVALNNIYSKVINAKKNTITSYKKTNKILKFFNDIKLQNVSFKYNLKSKKTSVKKLNIKISKNTIVGFAGPSGGGKSTIIDIIAGLLEPNKGQILIDGKKLNKNKLREWQNNFGIVNQMPFLSSDSIDDNISFGKIKDNIDTIRIKNLIKKVELVKFVKGQKKGGKSKISDRGINISGGERQRIAIARSLYFDNEIIIFDEATNALDKITEDKIIQFIKKLSNSRTIIIITHRVDTLSICDNIYVINEGAVVGEGKYNYLKKKNFFFKKLMTRN
jgi:ATP-binding cassette, subfamily B, bacterial PglK